MRSQWFWSSLVLAVAASGILVSCDEAEQGRVLRYEKGIYLGQPDTPLTAEQSEVLRTRTRMQGGS